MRFKTIAIAALVAGPLMMFAGYQEKLDHEKIVAGGVTVEGRITGGERFERRRTGATYKFDISFETKEGTLIRKNLAVPRSFADTHTSGETITNPKVEVIYLPDHPRECLVVGADSNHEKLLYSGPIVGLAGLVGTIMMVRKKSAA